MYTEYNYKDGKKRVEEILDSDFEFVDVNSIPNDERFTFNNGFKARVSAIFVDIRDSTTLFSKGEKQIVAKIVRAFTSEIIEILRLNGDYREIGIRGDCVYAIYSVVNDEDVYGVAKNVFYVNNYMRMLNRLLDRRKLPRITAGIGMSTSEELVVKAGRKGVDINDLVWIGDAVCKASHLSSWANRNGNGALAISAATYESIIGQLKKNRPDKNVESWFVMVKDNTFAKKRTVLCCRYCY